MSKLKVHSINFELWG